ncbi:MAG: glycosyltransferase family 4 protein [Planctomycetes bacterium]|nr:glycosyltransferase family 4 protein [Planctomycetota bacterium]
MRVLYVSHTHACGGAGRSLRFLIENLPPGAVQPLVLSPPGPAADGFRAAGAQVFPLPGVSLINSIEGAPLRGVRTLTLARELWNLRYGAQLRRWMDALAPDIVHVNERGMFQAVRIAAARNIPVVMHARSIADHSNPIVNFLDARLRGCVRQVVCIDECVRRSLRGYDRCAVIYNPLPSSSSAPRPARSPAAPVTVTFLSGLLPCKGVWDLMEAAKLLRRRTDIVFHVYGGNARPREFYETWFGRACARLDLAPDLERGLAAWIDREGLRSTVRMFGNVSPGPELFHATDILVFPSRLNGVGRSVYEAGVFGIPAVVAMEEPVEDIVEHNVTGLVVPPKDPSALAQAITRLADDPWSRKTLGENAQRKYCSQFAPAQIGRQMVKLYRDLLSDPNAGDHQACDEATPALSL